MDTFDLGEWVALTEYGINELKQTYPYHNFPEIGQIENHPMQSIGLVFFDLNRTTFIRANNHNGWLQRTIQFEEEYV